MIDVNLAPFTHAHTHVHTYEATTFKAVCVGKLEKHVTYMFIGLQFRKGNNDGSSCCDRRSSVVREDSKQDRLIRSR